MSWEIVDTGAAAAERNMSIDREQLKELATRERPQLRFYEWERPSITYGYFTRPFDYLNEMVCKQQQIDLARRPTGGGIVFHKNDLSFSVLIPASHSAYSTHTLDNYAFINRLVAGAVEKFLGNGVQAELLVDHSSNENRHFCYANPTKYDVMLEGKKVGGAAQRRTKAGFLHQGTLLITPYTPDFLSAVLLPGSKMKEAILGSSYSLLGEEATEQDCRAAKALLSQLLIEKTRRTSCQQRINRST